MGKIVFLADLDDTLFVSGEKLAPHLRSARAWVSEDGAREGFCRAADAALWECAGLRGEIWPLSARDEKAFARVGFAFGQAKGLDFGARIWDGERELEDWRAESLELASQSSRAAQEIVLEAQSWAQREIPEAQIRLRELLGMPFYAEAKLPRQAGAERRAKLAAALREFARAADGWEAWPSSSGACAIPEWANKRRAAGKMKQMARQKGFELVVGLADGLSDAAFLAECDWAMCPQQSALFKWMEKAGNDGNC